MPKAAPATLFLTVGAAVFWIGFDGGSYDATARASLAVAAWWAVAVAVGLSLWPLTRVPWGALLVGGLLAAYTAWIALSFPWGESAERTLVELNRASLYIACFTVAVLASRRSLLTPWLGGLAIGLSAIGIVALASRLFPNLVSETDRLAQLFPETNRRLSYPVNYWNGLAMIAAFAFPLLLFHATSARGSVMRGLALAPIPALAGTVYLTSSRGGAIAAGLGTLAFVALTGQRLRAIGAVVVAGLGSAFVLVVLQGRDELVNRPFDSELAAGQGRTGAVIIAIACVATAAVWAFVFRFLPADPRLPRAGRYVLLAGLMALLGVGIALADPRERFERFKELPPGLAEASVEEHLFSGSGNGRWQLWQVAADEFTRHPLTGRGAGTYEASWAEHGDFPFFVRDAHSLYLETAGELGLVGVMLLVGVLVSVLAVGAVRLRNADGPNERAACAALIGVLVAYLFESGFDWMWELTAISVVAFLAAGLLVGVATPGPAGSSQRTASLLRAAAVVGALILVVVQMIPFLSDLKLDESRREAAAGNVEEAVDDARAAATLTPWAASPRLQVALAAEIAGDLELAITSITEALDRDPIDWRLWLVAARLQTKAGDFEAAERSLMQAVALNPRSSLFR